MKINHATPLCFVDLETTGTSPRHHRVIEIGIVRVEWGVVVQEYRTFLNPEEPVPSFITSLTGISSAMLVNAPQFADVAHEVAGLLEGAVFVAHNAQFDYNFLSMEYKRLGMSFSYPYFCTAKLSRKLYPKVRGHSADALIARFGLDAGARHRALDDARVLHQFLAALHVAHSPETVYAAIEALVRVRRLPVHVTEDMLTCLPENVGVYRFYGKDNELLYVGKSRRIRTRVRSHFAKDGLSGRGQDMLSEIRRIDHTQTAGELGALILETHLIKTLGPVYNIREREKRALCVAREYTSDDGYQCVALEYVDTIDQTLQLSTVSLFCTKEQAKDTLNLLAREFELCPYLLALEHGAPCFAHQLERCRGACVGSEKPRHYNKRFREAFDTRRLKTWPYQGPVLIEERLPDGNGEVFLVDNWRLLAALHMEDGEWCEFIPATLCFDYDVYKILARELTRRRTRAVVREVTTREADALLGSAVVPSVIL